MAVSPTGTLPPQKGILAAGRDLLEQTRRFPFADFRSRLAERVRAERHWLWILVPYLAAWIQPALWLREQWFDIVSPLSFQPLVPLLFALILWTRRVELQSLRTETEFLFVPQSRMRQGNLFWVIAGCVLLLLGHLTRMPLAAIGGLLVAGIGVVFYLYGMAMIRALTLPFLFLMTMLPPPETIIAVGTKILQFGTAPATGTIVRKLGLYNSVQGTFINFPTHSVEITEQLSGAPLALPAMALALWMAIILRVRIGYAAVLVVVAGASAMALNILRIGLMGLIGGVWPAGMDLLGGANPYLYIAFAFYIAWYVSQALGLPEHEAPPLEIPL